MPLTVVKKTGGPQHPKIKKLKGLKSSILENLGQSCTQSRPSKDPIAQPQEEEIEIVKHANPADKKQAKKQKYNRDLIMLEENER